MSWLRTRSFYLLFQQHSSADNLMDDLAFNTGTKALSFVSRLGPSTAIVSPDQRSERTPLQVCVRWRGGAQGTATQHMLRYTDRMLYLLCPPCSAQPSSLQHVVIAECTCRGGVYSISMACATHGFALR